MKFGLFCEWPNPEVRDWKSLFEEGLEEIQYSEEMGFEYCLLAEHHFSNYGNSPAPLLQAAKIAERTRTLKIATGILVLPLWDPLRLAEEVAVLATSATDASSAAWAGAISPTKWPGSAWPWRSPGTAPTRFWRC
jgi:hypothetical protein